MELIASEGVAYIWAGGLLATDKKLLRWENGSFERIFRGNHPWSFTGTRGPQPDGRGTEHCLAILNDFYQVVFFSLMKGITYISKLLYSLF